MHGEQITLTDKQFQVLEAIQYHDNPSYDKLGEKIGSSGANIRKNYIPALEEKGLIEIGRDKRPHQKEVSDLGKEEILDRESDHRMSSEGSVSGSDSDSGEATFYHNFEMEFPVQNKEMLQDDWRERVIDTEKFKEKYFEEFDQYKFSFEKWRFRLTDGSVMVRLRDEVRGRSVREVREKAIDLCLEGAQLVEDETPIVLSDAPASYRIVSHHLGKGEGSENIMHEFARYIDQETDHNVSQTRVHDDDGELLIWCDKSSGELQEESGNGGNPSGSREKAVSTQEYLEEISEHMVQNREQTRDLLYRGPQKINAVHNQVQETVQEVEQVESSVQDMKQRQDSLVELKKEERQTRDTLMELVRSNQQVVQKMQEKVLEGELVQKVEQLEQRLEEVASSEGTTRGNRGGEQWEKPDYMCDRPCEADLKNISISTGNDTLDPIDLEQGMQFKDLHQDGKLLVLSSISLQENGDGYEDMCSIRVAGRRRTWNRIRRSELARLLNTERFEVIS